MSRGRGGWVRLAFYDYSAPAAERLARLLLLPDPEPVDPLDADFAFEGVPATEPAEGRRCRGAALSPAGAAVPHPPPSPRGD